jgi:NAD-dependent dihydropyrimidine dehydrogenase PreA subunit
MVIVNEENCKGCGRCVAACPKKCLEIGGALNSMGIASVRYKGEGCISCGMCFYNCPEPYALKVEKEK